MSGIILAFAGGSFAPPLPTVIGQAFGGGFYAGQIGVAGVATHYLIVAPKASGENSNKAYKNAATSTAGADSAIDGPQNTVDMVADGDSTVYPAAHFCNDLVIGGFSDWYMPAQNELEVCYYNLKPTTDSNDTSSGTNTNAVPSRSSDYTAGTPSQTTATIFQTGNAEAFVSNNYWSSTETASTTARSQNFTNGQTVARSKTSGEYVRAVRRIPV